MYVIVDLKNNGDLSYAHVKLDEMRVSIDHTRKQGDALHYDTELRATVTSKILNLVDIVCNHSNGNRFRVWRCTPCLD